MTNAIDSLPADVLATIVGAYTVRSNGYQGEPVIRGTGSNVYEARRNYMDNCRAAGNWWTACWINRVD